MKKWTLPLTGLTTTALLLSGTPATTSLADTVQVPEIRMNNAPVNFPDAKPYIDENDRTMVPVRFIAEGMGAKVDWFELTQTVVINMNGKDIRLHIGEDTATVNGTPSQLDTKTVKRNDRTYVPLRFVSETLGASVFWFGEQNVVSISFAIQNGGSGTGGQSSGNINDIPKPVYLTDVKDVDPWGRKTRTTNLPKNASDYPYILEDIPNDMYEMKYSDWKTKGDVQVPVTLDKGMKDDFTKKNIDVWMERVRKHFQLELNADYRTIDMNWANQMFDTLNPSGAFLPNMQKYVNWVKENEIQIEGTVEPEPSMIYRDGDGSFYVRCHIKYRVLHYKEKSNILFDPASSQPLVDVGVWYGGYTDVGMGSAAINHIGDMLSVSNVSSIFDNSWLQKL